MSSPFFQAGAVPDGAASLPPHRSPGTSTSWSDAVFQGDRPLVMLICADAERLRRLRRLLRHSGFLVARSESVDAAIKLLTQIRMDGCVACGVLSGEDAEALRRALDRVSPGCPKLHAVPTPADPPPGWTACGEYELVEAAWDAFARPFAGR
jgi:hypothetical protein